MHFPVSKSLMVTKINTVSVWMPTYNGAKFIGPAISSVINQSHRDIELLVWDDGSKDNTLELAFQWAEKDSRVKVFSTENRGIVRSLNAMMSHTRGDFVMRMDSDDVCYPHRIEKQLSYFEKNKKLGVLGCKVNLIGNQSGIWHYRQSSGETLALALLGNTPLCHPSWMVRRELFEQFPYEAGFQDMEDYRWLCRVLFETSYEGYATTEILMDYRIHADNISVCRKENQDQLRKRVLADLWSRLELSFNSDDVSVFTDVLLSGRFQEYEVLRDSVEKMKSQLLNVNSYTQQAIDKRVDHCTRSAKR